jgi:hypothetical protein
MTQSSLAGQCSRGVSRADYKSFSAAPCLVGTLAEAGRQLVAHEVGGREGAQLHPVAQGPTLLQFPAQRKHLLWDRGCLRGI